MSRRLLSLLALALLVGGCGLLRPPSPAPPQDAVLVLINRMDEPVRYVYLSPCAADRWGDDRLGTDEVVMPGRTREFVLAPGCWDFRAVLVDERIVDERGIEMTAFSRRTWTLFPE